MNVFFYILSSGSNITVDEQNFNEEHTFCEEYQWNGIIIPRTSTCSKVQIPCPDPINTIGTLTQKCNCESNEWEGEPDTTGCIHKWINVLNQLIEEGESTEYIAGQWAHFLQNTTQQAIYSGDIISSIDIAEQLLSLAEMQYADLDDQNRQNEKAMEFAKVFGEAGNELLSNSAAKVWMTLPDDIRVMKASKLLLALQQSAVMVAQFIIEKQMKINFSNWAFEVRVKKPIPITVQSDSVIMNDHSNFDMIPRPRSLASVSSINMDTLTSANEIEAEINNESAENITFSSFLYSPILSMPSLKILQQSAQPTPHPKTLNDFGIFARPRSRLVSLDQNSFHIGYYIFKSVGTLLNTNETTIINSLVIGASMNNPMNFITLPKTDPVTFKFYHLNTKGVSNPRCVFWDITKNFWSQEGCTTLRKLNNSTDCSCNHLTSFAILMDIDGSHDADDQSVANEVLSLITIIGCSFSVACLLLTLITFTCFESLHSIRHKIHCNLCFCLLLAELVFMIGIDQTENKIICGGIAVSLHYLFLAAFCWMLLEGYHLYFMLVQVFENKIKPVLCYIYAYGFPAVIVAITTATAWSNYGTDSYCWLDVKTLTIWAFAGPVAAVIISNIVVLGVALRVVLSIRSRDRSRTEQMLGWLKGSVTLLCLLGITWTFGYLMIIEATKTLFAFIFTVLNCLQGAFIFIIHVILNEKVRITLLRFLRVKMCWKLESGPPTNPDMVNSCQKLIHMWKKGYFSCECPKMFTENSDSKIKENKEQVFLDGTRSKLNGTESPTTMITYLNWKTKVKSECGSTGLDDSRNFDCEPKDANTIPIDIEMISNKSLSQSDSQSREKPAQISETSENDATNNVKEQIQSPTTSIIVERF
ncbi:unnamed protein product [Thelazia callipaeda]|uniref:Adhesion G protein-coupled receptor F3 n=1 Tax=Thelazia callipaeda TaxID=103827 RepID=A0A0N5CKX1_THECL|nr:unnamed protein product [Thelazia callipaeda]